MKYSRSVAICTINSSKKDVGLVFSTASTPGTPDHTAESVLCKNGAQRHAQNERSSMGQVVPFVMSFFDIHLHHTTRVYISSNAQTLELQLTTYN